MVSLLLFARYLANWLVCELDLLISWIDSYSVRWWARWLVAQLVSKAS